MLTQKQVETILKLSADGNSLYSIAAAVGCEWHTVQRYIRTHELNTEPKTRTVSKRVVTKVNLNPCVDPRLIPASAKTRVEYKAVVEKNPNYSLDKVLKRKTPVSSSSDQVNGLIAFGKAIHGFMLPRKRISDVDKTTVPDPELSVQTPVATAALFPWSDPASVYYGLSEQEYLKERKRSLQ